MRIVTDKYGDKSTEVILALGYLYLPIFIFLVTWINLCISIPVVIFLIYALLSLKEKDDCNRIRIDRKFIVIAGLLFVLAIIWTVFSGIGGFVPQSDDWIKHNIILEDLVSNPWPVRYHMRGESGVLSYYIGSYIVPAVFGKIFDLNVAQSVMILWTAIGICLTCFIVYRMIEKPRPEFLIGIFGVLCLFATFSGLLTSVYGMIVPTDAGDGVHWMSSSIRIQYTSNLMMMRWVSPQFVPAVLATALLIKNKSNDCYWGIICAPLILCSTFTFIGMIFLMVILMISNMLRQKSLEGFFQLFSRYNIISIAAGIPLVAYLLLNILQSKPESANFGIKILDYSENIPLLFCFELSWAIWAMIIWIKEKSNETLGAAVIILFFLPFLSMGEYNDLCMRASIPALSVLCILLAINFVGSLQSNRVYALVIMTALLVSAMGPMKEVASTVSQMNLRERNYIRKYETNEDYFFSYDYVKYQYIAWEETMISTILLQK